MVQDIVEDDVSTLRSFKDGSDIDNAIFLTNNEKQTDNDAKLDWRTQDKPHEFPYKTLRKLPDIPKNKGILLLGKSDKKS